MRSPLAFAAAVVTAVSLAVPAAALAAVPPEEPVGPVAYQPFVLDGARPAAGTNVDGPNAPRSTAVTSADPALGLQTSYVGRKSAEPTLGVRPDGTAVYAASDFDSAIGQARTEVYRSTDGGLTWNEATPLVAGSDYPPATLDPYVYVDQRTGRIYSIELFVAGSFLTYSDDGGKTWTPGVISAPGANDHQTFFTGPKPVGASLPPSVIDWPTVGYYCVNALTAVTCSRTLDGGATFQPLPSPPFSGCVGCQTGHGVVDSEGRVFLPRGDWLRLDGNGPAQLAISEDAGTSWKVVDVSTTLPPAGRHTAVAVDKADNVYYVWNDDLFKLPWMSVSRDHGQTWSKPMMVAPPGVHDSNFPMVAAGDAGRVAISFPGSSVDSWTDATRPWHAWVAVTDNALADTPTFHANVADDGTDPLHRGACDGRCAGMFDFIDLQTSPKDGTVWASFTDTCTAGNGCTTQRKADLATDAQGMAVRTTGYSLFAGAPTAAATTSSTSPTAPSAPSPVDSTAPKVEAVRADGRRVSWRLSEAGSVSVQVVRDGAILGSLTTGRPSTTGSTRLAGGRAGDTVVVRATDAAGNQGDAAQVQIAA